METKTNYKPNKTEINKFLSLIQSNSVLFFETVNNLPENISLKRFIFMQF